MHYLLRVEVKAESSDDEVGDIEFSGTVYGDAVDTGGRVILLPGNSGGGEAVDLGGVV